MKAVTIDDVYEDTGDELFVSLGTLSGHVYLDAMEGADCTCIALDRKGVKKLRKALKRALKEMP